ncbi:MAG: DNA-directed RNA polymerase subunit omega [Bacteriovoracia bacterium]
MARITVEDCLRNVGNMYDLFLVATTRVRQLYKGAEPTVKSKNRVIVTALREIAAGKVNTPRARATEEGGTTSGTMPN